MIRIDQIWLATEPMDMRAGPDTALARVVKQFGRAQPHHAYVFTNKRANRLKVLVHDGFGLWLAARRLHQGKFMAGMALRCNSITNNSRRWCWVCPGIISDNTIASRFFNQYL
jgi:hypothetical protein